MPASQHGVQLDCMLQVGQSARGGAGPSSATPALFNILGSMPARRPSYRGASASRLSATQEEPMAASNPLLTASHTEHACLDYDSILIMMIPSLIVMILLRSSQSLTALIEAVLLD